MEPVNISDIKAWSSIDIFLFSNGQQYSPPRKYHLRSEELQWWETTISYLGRTHYGSGHSTIELYSINGTKINGPLELINGGAYVAVKPPDFFINTGYEEYLLKASRSWEKRLTQKSYNTKPSNTDVIDLQLDKDPVVQNITNNINIADDIADTTLVKGGTNTINSLQKTRPTKTYQRQRKSISNSKPIQKKKSFDTHGNTLKRICAETDKVFPCPNKTSLKKNECIIRKPSTIARNKLSNYTNRELSSYCKKQESVKTELNLKTEAPINWATDRTSVKEPQIINLYNNEESDLMLLKNDPQQNAINDNSVVYHHSRSNLIEDNLCIQDECKLSSKPDNNQNFDTHSTHNLNQINECNQSDDFQKSKIQGVHLENISMFSNNNENVSRNSVLNDKPDKQIIEEYVAYMNKGGLLLLKVKVKLKDCKTILNTDKTKNIPTSTSLTNLPNTEKTSQVEINISFSGELIKSNEKQSIQNKSLQSLLNKLYKEDTVQMNSKDPRIVILQCACHNYSKNQKRCMCDDTILGFDVEGGKYEQSFNQSLHDTFTGCECPNKSANDQNEDKPPLIKTNGTRVKDLAQKFEKSGKIISNDRKNNNTNKNNSHNMSTPENKRQSVVLTRLIDSPVFQRNTDDQIIEENNGPISKNICDKSTQTDWCNLLLEARLHENDNYTFHLPSLYVLKQCNL